MESSFPALLLSILRYENNGWGFNSVNLRRRSGRWSVKEKKNTTHDRCDREVPSPKYLLCVDASVFFVVRIDVYGAIRTGFFFPSCPKQLRLAVALPNYWRCPKLCVDALLHAREKKKKEWLLRSKRAMVIWSFYSTGQSTSLGHGQRD